MIVLFQKNDEYVTIKEDIFQKLINLDAGQQPQRPQSMNPPNLAFRPPYAPYLAAPHVLRGFAPIQQQQQQQRQSFSQPSLQPGSNSRQTSFPYPGPSPVTAAQPHPITNSSNNQSQLLNVGVIPNQSEPRLDPNDFPALGAPTQQSQQQNQYSQATAPATLNQDDFPALSSDQSALNGVQSKSGDSIRQPYFPSNSSRTPAPSASQRDKRVRCSLIYILFTYYFT